VDRIQRRVMIPAELAGRRLDQAAAALLPEFSRSRLKVWIDSGQLTIAGASAEPKSRVRGGEELLLEAELEPAVAVEPERIPIEVVHRDEALLVIEKPAGLVVHPGAGVRSGTLQNALLSLEPALATLPRAGLVHRLDKDTSGLLLVARTTASHKALLAALERRQIKRTYLAICNRALTGGGTVDAPIGRHRRERTRMAVNEHGRAARTHYRIVERFRAHTHLDVELDTGRTHQIRVHMAHIRAPLVGDPVYGGRPRFPPRPSERLLQLLQSFPRQALHAQRLVLQHPASGETLAFESPVPSDLEQLLAVLREDAARPL
jgi:23S rRNA pseudouridine1911/1915/1917 synthase